MHRRKPTLTLLQATEQAPTLSRLAELASESRRRLHAVESLIPPHLRQSLSAGPIDGLEWCLLANNNAAAAKVRQLSPSLLAHLRSKGCEIDSIRIKVQSASSH
ncbi:MAG: hypothetical protein U1E84_09815 [Rhodoferax sp.]